MTKPKAPKKRPKAGQSRVSVEGRVKLFIEAYLSNGENLRESAIAAGYKPSAADKAGHRMSKSVLFLSELDKRRTSVLGPLIDRANRSMRETDRIAFMDPRRIIHQDGPNKGKVKTLDELDDETAAAVSSFKIDEYGRIEYKFWDKNNANERIHKQANLYKENNKGLAPVTQVAIVNLVPLEPIDSGLVVDVDS